LVEQVYERVAIPVMERAVTKGLGVLGRPVLWCYRRTIGSAVHSLVKRVNRKIKKSANNGESHSTSSSGFGTGAMRKYSESISRYTDLAAQLVAIVGRSIRRFLVTPLYVLFVVSLACATIPILIVRYVTKG
jgi:hypothetical protein